MLVEVEKVLPTKLVRERLEVFEEELIKIIDGKVSSDILVRVKRIIEELKVEIQ